MSITQLPIEFENAEKALTLKVLTTVGDIENIKQEWQELEIVCTDDCTYFQTYDWCHNWMTYVALEAGIKQAHIITVYLGNNLIALVPLMLSVAAGGTRILSVLGEPHTQYAGMLHDPVLYSDAAADLIRSHLETPDICDAFNIDLLPEKSVLNQILEPAFNRGSTENNSAAFDLSVFESGDDFVASFDSKKKKHHSKRQRRLKNKFGQLNMRAVWAEEPEYQDLVQMCMHMKRVWIAETGRISRGFALESYVDLMKNLTSDKTKKEGAVALVLTAGEQIVSLEISLIRKGRLYSYIAGFDWDLRNISPGKVQMEKAIGWSVDNGLTAYDLLGNVSDYKENWSNISSPLYAYCKSYTLKGWIFNCAWLTYIRPALKKGFEALPYKTRRFVGISRK